MFLFITEDFMDLATELLFQYISCSYLSRSIPFFSLSSRNFNTSHVLIYQRAGLSGVQRIVNFNTSHVLIYLILLGTIKWIRHISIHLMFLFIEREQLTLKRKGEFQYISCSYLSLWKVILEDYKKEFQYISCSYLSRRETVPFLKLLFQYISCSYLSTCIVLLPCRIRYFNTSHVLIYRYQSFCNFLVYFISIHLMFLFIYRRGKR